MDVCSIQLTFLEQVEHYLPCVLLCQSTSGPEPHKTSRTVVGSHLLGAHLCTLWSCIRIDHPMNTITRNTDHASRCIWDLALSGTLLKTMAHHVLFRQPRNTEYSMACMIDKGEAQCDSS